MRATILALTLVTTLTVGAWAPSASAALGDVAPLGAPDGDVNVADVILALRMSVLLEPVDGAADVSPSAPFGAQVVVRPDGGVDVNDIVALLRASVALTRLIGTVDVPDTFPPARFAWQGWESLFALLGLDIYPDAGGTLSGGHTPPDAQTCPEGGSLIWSHDGDSELGTFDSCDIGPRVVDGTLRLLVTANVSDYGIEVDLTLTEDGGDVVTLTGSLRRASRVEGSPGVYGTATGGLLEIQVVGPEPATGSYMVDLFEPDDGGYPTGDIYFVPLDDPPVHIAFDGSYYAIVTVMEMSGDTMYRVDLRTGEAEEI